MTTWPDKTANGKTLISPVAINVQGMVLVFAREAETPVEYLYYNVRVPGSTPGSAPPWSPLWADDDAWETDEWVGWNQLLMQEDSTGADSVPMIRVGGLDLITLPLARLPLTDTKATNISTPARADFQVASDGQYISIFRSTTNRTLFMDRFVLVEGQGPQTGSSGPTTTWTLQRAWEVRYQRSGQRDVAASAKDTPSSTNMLSRPFLEPTTELAFGAPVHDNQFTVVLAPTAAGGWRWHFFMVEEEASFLHHASYAQDATGRVLMDHGKIDALEMSALLSDPTTNDPVVRPLPALRGVGPAAVIYHEQEAGVTSNGTPTTVGRAARLMVVQTVVAGFGTTGTDSSIFAILDFQVNPDGTIAVPEKTPLLEGIDRQTTASGYNYLTPANGGFIIPPAAVHSVGSGTFMAAYYWKPWAGPRPLLLDGSDGLVRIYYAASPGWAYPGAFEVVQYSPVLTRSIARLPWSDTSGNTGVLQLVAQLPGSTLSGLSVSVGDCPGRPDLCTLQIGYGASSTLPAETWNGVPRELSAMVAVLNGGAADDPSAAAVQALSSPFYDYSGRLPQVALAVGTSATPTGYLTLVTHLPDLPLSTVTVTLNSDSSVTLAIAVAPTGGPTFTQTWTGLKNDVAKLVPLLRGDVNPKSYPKPAATDTVVYGLATATGSVLMFVASTAPPTITIAITAATSRNTSECDVTVTLGTMPNHVPNVLRDPTHVAAVIDASAKGVFAYFSLDPAGGSVIDQTVSARMSLPDLSVLFDVVGTSATGALVATTTPNTLTATPFQGHTPLSASGAPILQMLALSAVPLDTPLYGAVANIQDGAPTPIPGGNGMVLVPAAPPNAAQFNGSQIVQVDVTTPSALVLQPTRQWTVEAWCQPAAANQYGALVNYSLDKGSRGDGSIAAYYLAIWSGRALTFPAAPQSGSGSVVNIGQSSVFDDTQSPGTWEVWVNPSSLPYDVNVILQLSDNNGCLSRLYIWGTATGNTLAFNRYNSDGTFVGFSTNVLVPENTWTHVALTWTPTENAGTYTGTYTVYVNGVPGLPVPGTITPPASAPAAWLGDSDAGSQGLTDSTMCGMFSQLRFWNTARTSEDLKSFMYANPDYGNIPSSLLGWWPLDDSVASWGGGPMRNVGTLSALGPAGLYSVTGQTASSLYAGPFAYPVGAVGGTPLVRSNANLLLPANQTWNHVALTYDAIGALQLNQTSPTASTLDYASCSGSSLTPPSGSVEAWVIVPAAATTLQTIVSVWGAQPEDQAYELSVDQNGFLNFTIGYTTSSGGPQTLSVTSSTAVADGKAHHVVATWLMGSTTGSPPASPTPQLSTALFVDGASSSSPASAQAGGLEPISSDAAAFCVGMCALGNVPSPQASQLSPADYQYFSGSVSGVRVWSIALTGAQVTAAMEGQQGYDATPGVVSAWWFDEMQGLAAADAVGDNHLALSQDDVWIINPALLASRLYLNGAALPVVTAGTDGDYPSTYAQFFSIGGSWRGSTPIADPYTGSVAEVRVWSAALSADQIRDGMYRSLIGPTPGLVGYWPLNGNAQDATGRGNDGGGTALPTYVTSGAPVGNEAPEVWNPYYVVSYGSKPLSAFAQTIQGTPAVVEYGDTQVTADGSMAAVLRRATFWSPTGAAVALPLMDTGYGVGELDLVYIGQVQTNPTLTGFIEGAPPVPSENLSRPLYDSTYGYNAYADASTVSLVQPQTTAFTFSSQSSRSLLDTADLKAGPIAIAGEASAGLGLEEEFEKHKIKIGAHITQAGSLGTQVTDSSNPSWTTTFTETMGLRGAWEQRQPVTGDYLNPTIGRRYQPSNLGYALVESLTADLYSMQLRGSGVMVGTVVVPDPAIPPDKNIIMFPINPHYVKNGTLDGKVGLVNDPDYPNADVERGSYFKPLEAYALKSQIEQDIAQTRAFFDQFAAGSQGRSFGALMAGPGSEADVDAGGSVPSSLQSPTSQDTENGLVNTYVWSAYGGFYAEEEKFTSIQSRVFAGFSSFTGMGGLFVDGEITTPVAGTFGSVDLLFGSQVQLQVSKTETDTLGLGLSVDVTGEPVLQAYIPHAEDPDGTYSTSPAPGKVDTYRFLAFYLQPDDDNAAQFRDRVVDQNWLKNSSDPNAIALRSVNFDQCAPWRVLYRVTYVSRVPPPFNTNPSQSVGATPGQIIATQDNLLLIAMVQANLGKNAPTAQNLGAAVQMALGITTPPKGLPSLSDVLPWWTAFTTYAAANPASAQAAALMQIQLNAYNYVTSGYATNLLPLSRRPLDPSARFRRAARAGLATRRNAARGPRPSRSTPPTRPRR